MTSISCINCGANLNVDTLSKYIKCDYCKTFNSNFSAFDKVDSLLVKTDKNEDVYKNLNLSFKLKDYSDVKKISNNILNENPNSWIALTYLSIAEFWLGYDDFKHLENLYGLIEKAKLLSNNNELVVDAANKIANDIIVFGTKNRFYGDEIKNALFAFKIARKMSTLDPESEECLKIYLLKAFEYQKNQLEKLLAKNKKDYDPPYISLTNIFEFGSFYNNKEILEYFYLHAKIHLEKGKSKSYYNELLNKLKNVEDILKSLNSEVIGKNISFSFFGEISIK